MIPARGFPVLRPPEGCAQFVTWSSLSEDLAQKHHGQSLAQLARRGGLTPYEITVNVRRLKLHAVVSEASAIEITNGIAQA